MSASQSPPVPVHGAPAVVLLSGGLDSATVLAMARQQGFAPHALSFRYGQRHAVELQAAERVARNLGVTGHTILDIDLTAFGGSALTDPQQAVPKQRSDVELAAGIPPTYVPARNTIFLAFALGRAETLACQDIFIGVNALDYSGYPDCRPDYLAAFQQLANLATQSAVEAGKPIRIHAPLLKLTKAEIIQRGLALEVDYSLTISCYDPATNGDACRQCDACRLRQRGFDACGIADPALAST